MKKYVIKIDSDEGKFIKFTSDLFESGTIWNRLPHGIYITNLLPRRECFFEALKTMFDELDRLHLKVRYVAPQPTVELFLIKRGYVRYIDAPGTPEYCNCTIPTSCVLAPRTEEEIETLDRMILQSGFSNVP